MTAHIPNPFEVLNTRLTKIEGILLSLQNGNTGPAKAPEQAGSEYMPLSEIIGPYISKPTFYNHVKTGLVKLYKLGNRSFVKRDEFFAAFKKAGVSVHQNRFEA